jgi:hypothetical protein
MSPTYLPVPLPFNPQGLALSMAQAPCYLKPLFRAAMSGGCELAMIAPGSGPFPSPTLGQLPWLSVIAADFLDAAAGPDAFDHRSLASLLKASAGIFVMAGKPAAELYDYAARFPIVTGESSTLIEISTERVEVWRDFLRRVCPDGDPVA